MSRGGRFALAVTALVWAQLAGAQEIQFVEPGAGTVRGTVPVRADLGAGYANGFVIFYLGEPGQPMKFKVATVADPHGLFGFDWETQGRDSKVPDGEYRLMAVGYNAAGEAIGQKAVTVEVQNQVTSTSLPARGIQLRYNFTPGRDASYVARSTINVEAGDGTKGADVSMFNGQTSGWWNAKVLWRNPDGRAHVRHTVFAHSERGARGENNRLEASGQFLSLMIKTNGEAVRRTEQASTSFPYADMSFEFPRDPVKVKDSWRSPMRIIVDPRTGRQDTVIATHLLSAVEWHAGYRAAVIDSEFECGPYRMTIKGEDKDDAEWLADVTLTIKGHRRTYFAYQPEVGRVLRVEERQDQACTFEQEEEPPAPVMGMGMDGGYSGDPGMMMEGAPVMPGGVPGSGVPGAVGAEAGLAAAPVAAKPAGWEKASRSFRQAKPAAAAGTAGTPAPAGPPPEPPKVDILHFKRVVTTRLSQDYLDTGQ